MSVDVFKEIRRNWHESLSIVDLIRAGGFDPDLLDIDVHDISDSSSNDSKGEDVSSIDDRTSTSDLSDTDKEPSENSEALELILNLQDSRRYSQ